MVWSQSHVEGALAFFAAGKTVPKFKFTSNQGRSELVKKVGGPNPKAFYEGVAQVGPPIRYIRYVRYARRAGGPARQLVRAISHVAG